MNRMVKLFQSKANIEYEKYLQTRAQVDKVEFLAGDEWQQLVLKGAKHLAAAETWQRAAELLRKEELNHV